MLALKNLQESIGDRSTNMLPDVENQGLHREKRLLKAYMACLP